MKGEVAQKALRGDDAGAAKAAGEFRDIFGAGNYYFELMVNGMAEQEKANRALLHHRDGLFADDFIQFGRIKRDGRRTQAGLHLRRKLSMHG